MNKQQCAALHLHGLCDDDRHWVLSQLSAEHTHVLKPLLNELVELGIPRESTVLAEIHGAEGLPIPRPSCPSVDTLLYATTLHLATVLSNEADEIIAAVLLCHDWPWRENVMNEMPAPRQHRIGQLVRQDLFMMTRRMRDTLLKGLCVELKALSEAVGIDSEIDSDRRVSSKAKKPARRWSMRRRFA
ncbi:MAG: hypothetical protein V3T17_12130 [Pseudomonadales bacterium]